MTATVPTEDVQERQSRPWASVRRGIPLLKWGIADQVFSSASNLLLMVTAGRVLGPSGLGIVFVGFSTYLVALGFQRALITEPLVVFTARSFQPLRTTRAAMTMVLVFACAATTIAAVASAISSGPIARGIVVFLPWLVPALLQDYWRSILFRDGRSASATANDALWLVLMLVVMPFAWTSGSDWVVVAVWGTGALAGAVAGFGQTRLRPLRLGPSFKWWRREAANLGGWLAAQSMLESLLSYARVLALAALIGTAAYGGLRAVYSIFGPLSLLLPALSLPGLPAVSRAYGRSEFEARRLAIGLSLLVTLVTVAYVAVLGLAGGLLPQLFGGSFSSYEYIILPIGFAQIAVSATAGLPLLLRAEGRGRTFFMARSAASISGFIVVVVAGVVWGVSGVAWGALVAGCLNSVALAAATFTRRQGA